MVAASELRLMRSKSESSARVMVMDKKEEDGNTILLKHYIGFVAERSTTASPSPPLDLTKSGGSSKGVGVGLLHRISSSGSQSKSASLKQNGSDEAAKNTSDDDDIKMSKRSGSSKRGGMGLLLRRMPSNGSKNAALEGNNDEASGEKVDKTSSETEERDICSGSEDDASPHGESEQKNQPPPQSVEDDHNLRCSAMQLVQRFESGIETKSRVRKNTIERGISPRPPLPQQIQSTSRTDIKKNPKHSKIPLQPSSSLNCTLEIIKCNDSTLIHEASNSNVSNKEGRSTSEPESSTIVRSSSGQSTKSQTPKIRNTISKTASAREGLPPIPVTRSSGNNLNSEVNTPLPMPMPMKKSRAGLGSAAAGGGVASIRRSVSGWSNQSISSSEINRCSSECPGNRFGLKQLIKGGSSIQNHIVTKNRNTDERKTPENESILKPGGSFERTSSEVVVSSKNAPKSLQSISFESNHSSLIKVTHSKTSIIKMHTPVMSKSSSEMMASSFAVSPREGLSSELGLDIVVYSMDDGKPILRAESAIGNAFSNEDDDDDDDEQREDAENEGGREHLCISTDGVCTPSSRGISGLEVDMKDCRFGYGYSLYVKSLEIYQRELELKKMEEKTKESQEQETETHGEQEEKLAEEKLNAEGNKVEEEKSQSSDSDVPDETTKTTGWCLPIITIIETTKIKKFSEYVTTSAKPTVEATTTSRSLVDEDKNEKATSMFCGHEWKQLSLLPIITIVETTKIKQFFEHVATCTVTTATTSSKPTVLEDTTTPRSLAEEDKNEKATSMFGGHQWKQLRY